MLPKIQIYNMLEMSAGEIHHAAGLAALAHSLYNQRLVRGVIQPGLEYIFNPSLIHIHTFLCRLLCENTIIKLYKSYNTNSIIAFRLGRHKKRGRLSKPVSHCLTFCRTPLAFYQASEASVVLIFASRRFVRVAFFTLRNVPLGLYWAGMVLVPL